MSKIKCPECGTRYKGNFCPNCSAPAPEEARKKKKGWLLPAILVLAAIFLISGMGGSEDPQPPSGVRGDSSVSSAQACNPTETVPAEAAVTEAAHSPSEEKASIEQTELYNKNGVSVTATKLEEGLFGPEISVTVSNETERNITVSTQALSVNGYMLSGSGLYAQVAAGKKAIEGLTLMRSDLSEAGIETVADIEFYIHVSDSDTWDDIDNSGLIKLSTSAAEGFTQPIDDSGDPVYDANGVRVICKGLKDDTVWDGCVVFYLENNSGRDITVYSENVSVNGFMVDESLWSDLRANTRSIEGMYLLSLDNIGLESVEDVESIEFNLCLIDDNWNNIAVTDVITLNFT